MSKSNRQCDFLDDYVDDLVDSERRAVFRHHLQSCSKCQRRIESNQLAIDGCREIWRSREQTEMASNGLVSLADKCDRPGLRISRQRGIVVFGGAAAVLLVITFAARHWMSVDTSNSNRPVAEVQASHSPYAVLTSEQISELILRVQQDSRQKKSTELLNQVLNVTSSHNKRAKTRSLDNYLHPIGNENELQ